MKRKFFISLLAGGIALFGARFTAMADLYHFHVNGTLVPGNVYGDYTTLTLEGLDLTQPTSFDLQLWVNSSNGGNPPWYFPGTYGGAVWNLHNSSGSLHYETAGAMVVDYSSTVNSQHSIRLFGSPMIEVQLWYDVSFANSTLDTFVQVINTHPFIPFLAPGNISVQTSMILGESTTAYEYFTASVDSVTAFVTPIPEPSSAAMFLVCGLFFGLSRRCFKS
jgi:hypothetical protein